MEARVADDVDRASELEQQAREDALRRHARRSAIAQPAGASAEFCERPGCGVPISAARRAAVPGCRLCVVCQGRFERGEKA